MYVCLSVCNIGVLWPNGWMDQEDATWGTEVGLGPGHIVLDGDSAPLHPRKGAQLVTAASTFWPVSIVSKQSPISATAELSLFMIMLSCLFVLLLFCCCCCKHQCDVVDKNVMYKKVNAEYTYSNFVQLFASADVNTTYYGTVTVFNTTQVPLILNYSSQTAGNVSSNISLHRTSPSDEFFR